ncbi:MAG: ABC transporter permease [Oscillospiraceae bacterium]|nr:ABC transporter permease [Oscillospiraceae bacterium]
MRSKTSYFNKTLFFNMISRYWPLWAAYTAIWLIILPIGLHGELRYSYSAVNRALSFVLNAGLYGGVVMSAIFGALAAMAVFGFMYYAKSANAIFSLPIRRSGLFATALLSGLACLFAANIITFLAAAAVLAAYGASASGGLFIWLGLVCMCNVFFYGFAVFTAQLTGNAFGLPALYLVLNFAVAGAEAVVRFLLESIVYGMSYSEGILNFLSPVIYIFERCSVMSRPVSVGIASDFYFYYFDGWPAIIIYCAAGLLFMAGAFLLFRRRHAESASDIMAVKALNPVFKYCLSIFGSLTVGALLFGTVSPGDAGNPAAALIVCLLLGGFVGYFAARMLLCKSFKVFRQGWAGFAAFAAVVIVFTLAWEFDLFGYERRIPDSGNVESVTIRSYGNSAYLSGAEGVNDVISAHEGIVANKALHDRSSTSGIYYGPGGVSVNGRRVYLTVNYKLKNGKSLNREYSVFYNDSLLAEKGSDIAKINKAFNCKEAVEHRVSTSVPITERTIIKAGVNYYSGQRDGYTEIELSAAWAYEFYEKCVLPDIRDGTLGLVWIGGGPEYENKAYNCSVYIDLAESRPDSRYEHSWFRVEPTVDSARTVERLKELGITLYTYAEYNRERDDWDKPIYPGYALYDKPV